jgi:hypothetical protein
VVREEVVFFGAVAPDSLPPRALVEVFSAHAYEFGILCGNPDGSEG